MNINNNLNVGSNYTYYQSGQSDSEFDSDSINHNIDNIDNVENDDLVSESSDWSDDVPPLSQLAPGQIQNAPNMHIQQWTMPQQPANQQNELIQQQFNNPNPGNQVIQNPHQFIGGFALQPNNPQPRLSNSDETLK